jgi:hypothetical protein
MIMNSAQVNKSRMYLATDKVLDANLEKVAGIDELMAAHLRFKGYLKSIEDNRQVQVVNQTGLTESKITLRDDLTQLLLKSIAGLTAHATTVKDAQLRKKVQYVPSALARMADPVFADVARLIRTEALNNAPSLTKFFVTAEDLDLMGQLTEQFMVAIPQKRVATNISKVSTSNIGDVFAAADKLLKQELDLYMLPFQFTLPDFYNAYKNARIIVNYSGRGKGSEPPADDEPAD